MHDPYRLQVHAKFLGQLPNVLARHFSHVRGVRLYAKGIFEPSFQDLIGHCHRDDMGDPVPLSHMGGDHGDGAVVAAKKGDASIPNQFFSPRLPNLGF